MKAGIRQGWPGVDRIFPLFSWDLPPDPQCGPERLAVCKQFGYVDLAVPQQPLLSRSRVDNSLEPTSAFDRARALSWVRLAGDVGLVVPQQQLLSRSRVDNSLDQSKTLCKLVSPAGIEPATYALGGRRAIQLCHEDLGRKYILMLRSTPPLAGN